MTEPLFYNAEQIVGCERRERVSQLAWCGEGCFDSRRRVNSIVEADGRNIMKRTWTIIGVSDVPSSFKWYLSLFGQPERRPEHSYFGQILDSDGTVLLCLHEW